MCQNHSRAIDAAPAEAYGNDGVARLGKIQQHLSLTLPHLCVANFSLGFYNWDTCCLLANHSSCIKWPPRVTFDLLHDSLRDHTHVLKVTAPTAWFSASGITPLPDTAAQEQIANHSYLD